MRQYKINVWPADVIAVKAIRYMVLASKPLIIWDSLDPDIAHDPNTCD
jgi:hypothetical protein